MPQIQQTPMSSFVPHIVPAPVEVQPNETVESAQTVSPSHIQTTLTDLTIPPKQNVAIQSNLPSGLANESNELYANFNNTYVDKSPCINPNFSKIIDLPVTPSPPPILEEPSENSTDDVASSPSKTNDQSPVHIENHEPKVPLSHLIATNQYPSLNRIPPANIVQSFTPVYNQSNQQHHQSSSYASGNENEELYNSYVNNPYNLTLHVEQNFGNASPTTANHLSTDDQLNVSTTTTTTTSPSNLNVFQSVNYFGTASDNIPPGSEMLFGSP